MWSTLTPDQWPWGQPTAHTHAQGPSSYWVAGCTPRGGSSPSTQRLHAPRTLTPDSPAWPRVHTCTETKRTCPGEERGSSRSPPPQGHRLSSSKCLKPITQVLGRCGQLKSDPQNIQILNPGTSCGKRRFTDNVVGHVGRSGRCLHGCQLHGVAGESLLQMTLLHTEISRSPGPGLPRRKGMWIITNNRKDRQRFWRNHFFKHSKH